MNGRKNFHTNLKNQPNEPIGERVVSERGRKELPPSTRGGENLKPNRYYEHKQHAFDSYCKKEYTAFPVGNAVVLIENDRLATALLRLSPKDREIFMMHWFLWMTDEQIAKCMGMARRTVNTRRYKAYRLLKKLMGGEADD